MATTALSLDSKLKLRDGNEIPILGFGTYDLPPEDTAKAVVYALRAGYRHIDSAAWYENEKECGEGIRQFCEESGVPRSEIFFTTKLKQNNGYVRVKRAIQASLEACQLGYIDLYLIHGPEGGPRLRKESWQAICDAQKEGKLKSIGISTFGIRHMEEMIRASAENTDLPLPVINQIDLHPFRTRTKLVAFCKSHGIALEAWAPLIRGGKEFNDPLIKQLAEKHGKTPAQVLLRYSLQKGYIPLPKSSSEVRIKQNTDLFGFALEDDEVASLDKLDKDLVTDWDPSECP
ncbi:aldo-keto reductase [Leucogyrophana mollusca]|uniref:Aldo-keto reductase n=1 Tax=Leucogyrophana mollusca TaxID=85980 RepID=A0ACB8BRR9_9AGAM|nr:aldo-keto reductase [Leucogyrophana mollusca]